MTSTGLFIDSDTKLKELLASIATEPRLAVDTEFVREKTYYPRLCLIQVATPEVTACIDCIATIDLAPFFDRLFENGRAWVLHSARQDLEVLYQQDERTPQELIDTQTAAALLGHAPQIGLQALLASELGIQLDKEHTRTDWSRRPLPDAAVRYALDDVHYLLPLWQKLEQQLNVLQRGTWFKSDCVTALAVPPITPPEALWARLRGLRSMQPQQQCAALALVGWRERYAQALDRPRRWIMSDELLLRIARTEPDSVASLKSVPEIPERLADRAGIEIISELRSCDGASQRSLLDTHLMTDRPDKSALQSLQERVQRRAEELGIQTEVLATRKEMSELLVGRPSERIDGGWRHSELQNLLANSQHIE